MRPSRRNTATLSSQLGILSTKIIAPEPGLAHTHTIILLHHRDSSFFELATKIIETETSRGLSLPEIFPTVKWVFPSADMLHNESSEEYRSEWFDI